MRGRAAAVALPAVLVLALVALVAIAATGSTPDGTNATRPPSETLYDILFTLGLVAVFLGGVLLVYGLMQRRAIANELAKGKHRRTGVVAYLAFFAVFTAYSYWRLESWSPPEPQEEEQGLSFPDAPQIPSLPEEAETSYTPTVAWIPIVVVAALVLAAVAAYVLSERRARRGHVQQPDLTEQLAAVLDDTLDDLRGLADPRRAIVAAYARLERTLEANGLPRLASETADEYLPRVLRAVDVDPSSVTLLTSLFTRAKFSPHAVDPAMKEEAIDALERVREDLRRSSGRSTEQSPAPIGAPA